MRWRRRRRRRHGHGGYLGAGVGQDEEQGVEELGQETHLGGVVMVGIVYLGNLPY